MYFSTKSTRTGRATTDTVTGAEFPYSLGNQESRNLSEANAQASRAILMGDLAASGLIVNDGRVYPLTTLQGAFATMFANAAMLESILSLGGEPSLEELQIAYRARLTG